MTTRDRKLSPKTSAVLAAGAFVGFVALYFINERMPAISTAVSIWMRSVQADIWNPLWANPIARVCVCLFAALLVGAWFAPSHSSRD